MGSQKCVSCGITFFSPMGSDKCSRCAGPDSSSHGGHSCGCGHSH